MIKVDPKGKVLEYAESYLDEFNVENIFALIEISGIRLIGSVIGSGVSVNNSVLLKRCGFKNNVYPFYEFRIVDNGDQS